MSSSSSSSLLSSSSIYNIEWFENICIVLSSNPNQATEQLSSFRESQNALNDCHAILSDTRLSHIGKFQVTLVLQYSMLKQWPILNNIDRELLRNSIWVYIEQSIINNNPSYVINKLMQVYSLIWKRGWCEYNDIEKQSLYDKITLIISNFDGIQYSALLLRMIIEEFSTKSSAQVGLPLEFHRISHGLFESFGLHQSFHIAIHMMKVTSDILQNNHDININIKLKTIDEVSLLFIELMNWDFDYSTNEILRLSKENGDGSRNLLTLPRDWAFGLLDPVFLKTIYDIYETLMSLIGACQSDSNLMQNLLKVLSDLRSLMITMASLSGKIFDDDSEKVSYGDCIVNRTVPLLDKALQLNPGSDDELRAKECEQFSSILVRLIGNFRLSVIFTMSSFEMLMLALGRTAFGLSKEMSQIVIKTGTGTDEFLDGWRGNTVNCLLDAWCMILDDPLMLQFPEMDLQQNFTFSYNIQDHLKMGLRNMASDVFKQLADSVINMTLSDTFSSLEEEEDEDNEAIGSRTMDDILSSICTIGRSNFLISMTYIHELTKKSLEDCKVILSSNSFVNNNACLKELEILRICTLFSCHLLDDMYKDDIVTSGSEAPVIPLFVMDCCFDNPNSIQIFNEHLNIMCQVLQMETHLLPAKGSNTHPLFSPYLIQNLMNFFRQYFHRYVDPDLILYKPQKIPRIQHLLSMHGGEFDNVIALLMNSMYQCLHALPMENNLVVSIASLFKVIAKVSGQRRSQSILAIPSLSNIVSLVNSNDVVLKSESVALLVRALTFFSIQSKCEAMFLQLYSSVGSSVESLSNLMQQQGGSFQPDSVKHSVEKMMAYLRGMATCQSRRDGQEKLLHSLFDKCFPVLAWSMQFFKAYDDTIEEYILLVRDYAEIQLPALSKSSSLILYRSALSVLETLSERFKQAIIDEESEAVFRSNSLLRVLELLNHLATKDFLLDDDFETNDVIENDASATIADVLIYGLDFLIPIITPDLLRSFPVTCDRYFSFLSFMVSVYEDKLGLKISGLDENAGKIYLNTFVQHMLWGAGAIDGSSARLALLGLQTIASYQLSSMRTGKVGFGLNVSSEIFTNTLERLLQMLIFPATCEYGIAMDRLDACSNSLLPLIALNVQRFTQCAQQLIQQQLPQYQQALIASFEKLTTNNGIIIIIIQYTNKYYSNDYYRC